MRANLYVDGFNLYYGALRGTPWKWLDLACLGHRLLPGHDVARIRYFTARVSATPGDPGASQRQHCYLRALRTVPGLSVHLGVFRSRVACLPLVDGGALVRVVRTEEKGSDVNLASWLLMDAFHRECELALVVSNDSDLLQPIRLVRKEFRIPVGVVNPHPPGKRSRALVEAATFFRQLRPAALRECQFAPQLVDAEGELCRPTQWA